MSSNVKPSAHTTTRRLEDTKIEKLIRVLRAFVRCRRQVLGLQRSPSSEVAMVSIALLLCLAIQSPAATDEAAVRDVVKKYVDARERSDESAIRALFTDDADQLTSSGEWRKGRENVVRGTLASSKGNPGSRTIAVETVRFPAPGLAIADGRYEISGGPEGTRKMWTSFVMTRSAQGWRIAAIRNMLPSPAAPPPK
jgi:uncharacterized protein (TIGR02246 family)